VSEEERQRMMDFILEQQAQFSVHLAQTQESVKTLAEAQERTERTVVELAAQVQLTARQQEHINEVVAVIAATRSSTRMSV
jgi:hypothetical protein